MFLWESLFYLEIIFSRSLDFCLRKREHSRKTTFCPSGKDHKSQITFTCLRYFPETTSEWYKRTAKRSSLIWKIIAVGNITYQGRKKILKEMGVQRTFSKSDWFSIIQQLFLRVHQRNKTTKKVRRIRQKSQTGGKWQKVNMTWQILEKKEKKRLRVFSSSKHSSFSLEWDFLSKQWRLLTKKKHFLKTFPYIYIFLIFKPFITHLPTSKSEIKIFIPDAL